MSNNDAKNTNNTKKKIIIVSVILVVAIAAVVIAYLKPGDKKKDETRTTAKTEETIKTPEPAVIGEKAPNTEQPQQTQAVEQEKVQPTTEASVQPTAKATQQPAAQQTPKPEPKPQQTQAAEVAEPITPEHNINVMYLISNSNENKDELLKMAEELQKEYETKVYFTVMNIDEDEMGANFALPDETPKLVMFGENNLFEMKNNCADKEELKQIIDSAINK